MNESGRLVLASNNPGKLKELRACLAGLPLRLVGQDELGIAGADEPAVTFVENALLKARHAARESGLPALADDSGLEVPALGGQPGVRSARFAGDNASDQDNINRLLAQMTGLQGEQRRASFHSLVVLLRHADDPTPLICQGRWDGYILNAPKGDGGFGYDPIFHVPALEATAAELPATVKNRVSHRALALAELRRQLPTIIADIPCSASAGQETRRKPGA